jgi:hypothetical protein
VKRAITAALAILALAACNEPSHPAKLPGASLTPELARPAPNMCGIDVDWNADDRVDLRYTFTLDDLGRISHGQGVYTSPHADATIDYDYDNLDRLVQYIESAGTWRYTSSALYSSLGDLVEYTTVQQGQTQHTTYSDFTETGMPRHEVIADGKMLYPFSLEYDAWSRILRAAPADGPPTIYSYDDDARTTLIDSQGGAYRGVVVYDEQNHVLSETWTGDDYSRENVYTYEGDRLLTSTHREAGTTQIDTYRYDCD